jgi:NAD(P)-dependent dehydrogenase (short-subunit alcohol dehydrogenase family)
LTHGGVGTRRRATWLPSLQGSISAQQLDLADLASVRAAAAELQRLPRIDYMILNAGVMVGVCLRKPPCRLLASAQRALVYRVMLMLCSGAITRLQLLR